MKSPDEIAAMRAKMIEHLEGGAGDCRRDRRRGGGLFDRVRS